MEQLNPVTEEILYCCQQIFENIGVEFEISHLELFQENIYIEIFKIMFPFLDNEIDNINKTKDSAGNKIQNMINLLSSDILTMDLCHISGELIAKGDQKHLLNFQQIILELSKLYKMRNIEQDEDPQSQNGQLEAFSQRTDQAEKQSLNQSNKNADKFKNVKENQNKHQSNGSKKSKQKKVIQIPSYLKKDIENQLLDIELDSQGNPMLDPDNPQHAEIMKQIQQNLGEDIDFSNDNQKYNVIQEPVSSEVYSDEDDQKLNKATNPIQNKQKNNQNKENKQNNLINDKQQLTHEKEQDEDNDQQNYPNTKKLKRTHSQKKLQQINEVKSKQNKKSKKIQIEQQIIKNQEINLQTNQKKVIKKNKLKKIQDQNQNTNPENIQIDFEQENLINLNNLSPQDINRLQEIQELIQSGQIKQDDPIVLQYIESIQNKIAIQNQEDLQIQQKIDQLNKIDMSKIIAEQHQNVVQRLIGMRNNQLPEDDKYTMDLQQKQKKEYSNFLKRYLNQHRISQNLFSKSKNLQEENQQKKLKILKNESQMLQKEIDNEQKSTYYKLRDEKINYLRKIHKIIFDLEKRKIINDKSIQKDERKQRNQETRNVLESVQNAYKDRINLLNEKQIQKRKERQIANVAQREVISKIERELRQEKRRQIQEFKDQWKQEQQNFDMVIKDDGLLEQKIMQLYKKY